MTKDEQELARVEVEIAVLNALIERDTDLTDIDAGMTDEERRAEEREFIEHMHTQAAGRAATRALLSGGVTHTRSSLPPVALAFPTPPYPRVQ